MDQLEDLHADRTYICFTTMDDEVKGWEPVKLAYGPPVIYYRPFQGGTFNMVLSVKCSVVFRL